MRASGLLATGAVLAWITHSYVGRFIDRVHLPIPAPMTEAAAGSDGLIHFSPAENLERLDAGQLRGARKTVDILMYAFTDQLLARILVELASRGVVIRLYRDRSQYDSEQRNAMRFRTLSTTQMLVGHRGIHIRVKGGSERNLMHAKTVCLDHRVLRDGSANWSPGGEKAQDNSVRYTTDPGQIAAFDKTFEAMWARSNNAIIQ